MKRVLVRLPATSANLGPGFDVLGVALRLYNEVQFEMEGTAWSPQKNYRSLTIDIAGEGVEILPRDKTNLVVRAASKVFDKIKRWPQALRIKLSNRIPLSRGLGSSAAATLSGILAANHLAGDPLKAQELLDLAVSMEGHPDNIVPAFVGGFCLSAVIGQKTQYLKFPAPAGLRAVVCSPEKPLATSRARSVLPRRIPFSDAVFTSSRVAFLIGALVQRRFDLLDFAMDDILHQPSRARLVPGLMGAIDAAKRAGAWGGALSGAGSSVIALVKPGTTARRVGPAMQQAFAAKGVMSRWSDLGFDNVGSTFR